MKATEFMGKATNHFIIFMTVCFFLYCGGEKQDKDLLTHNSSDPGEGNRIVLRVQETFYFNSDFEPYVTRVADEGGGSLPAVILSRLFDSFIEEKLLLEDSQRRNIALSQTEKDRYLATFLKQLPSEVQEKDWNADDLKDFFEKLLVEKLVVVLSKDIDASEEEIKEYYQRNRREFLRPEQVKVSQIFFRTEEKAIRIYEQVKNVNEEGFKFAAREFSQGAERSRGGLMGVFALGQLPVELQNVVFSLETGEISPVVESSYGYHIFRLDEKYEPQLISEEEAASSIKAKILEQKIAQFMSEYVDGLKSSIEWNVYPENLTFIYQRKNDD